MSGRDQLGEARGSFWGTWAHNLHKISAKNISLSEISARLEETQTCSSPRKVGCAGWEEGRRENIARRQLIKRQLASEYRKAIGKATEPESKQRGAAWREIRATN